MTRPNDLWVYDGPDLGAWCCPYCDDLAGYALDRIDDKKHIYMCECGKRFEFMWDTCPDGEGGSNLVVALVKEIV
jgi:hypothetical protein